MALTSYEKLGTRVLNESETGLRGSTIAMLSGTLDMPQGPDRSRDTAEDDDLESAMGKWQSEDQFLAEALANVQAKEGGEKTSEAEQLSPESQGSTSPSAPGDSAGWAPPQAPAVRRLLASGEAGGDAEVAIHHLEQRALEGQDVGNLGTPTIAPTEGVLAAPGDATVEMLASVGEASSVIPLGLRVLGLVGAGIAAAGMNTLVFALTIYGGPCMFQEFSQTNFAALLPTISVVAC
jgi:hypothetical protein